MFKTRLLSGVLLVIAALVTIIIGDILLFGLTLIISLLGFSELLRIFKVEKSLLGLCGYAFAVLHFLFVRFGELLPSLLVDYYMVIIILYIIVLMTVMVLTYPKYKVEQILATFFGFFYVVVMLSFIYQVRMLPLGAFTVWLIFICSWGSDTSAYCAGMTLGKRKLAPVLSPKKSVEGAIGGVLGAALLGFLYALAINHFAAVEVGLVSFAIIGAIGSVISQIGDLAASAFKRYYDIKDYGSLIPGHGGILDRFDSVIFTAPVIFILVNVLGMA